MAILDRDLNYIAHSERWLRYWGLSESLVGRNQRDVDGVAFERYRAEFERALAGEVVGRSEDAVPVEGGRTVYMKVS